MANLKQKRRQEIAKFLKAASDLGAPKGVEAAERTIWVILARHGSKEGATRASNALWRRFVDANECRVAKATEIASIIQRHVKNEAIVVAEQIRGFLRRFHKDHHTMDYGHTETLTNEQVKKYLTHIESYAAETALALFLYTCGREEAWQEEAAEVEDKSRKRGEREVIRALDRMKLYCAVAAFGSVPAKTKQNTSFRYLGKAWAFAALPPRPTLAEKAKAAKKKKTTVAKKKAVAKKTKKKTTARGGGTARPRTTRATRKRTVARKSSRR